jgi:molecular chaperone GrpE
MRRETPRRVPVDAQRDPAHDRAPGAQQPAAPPPPQPAQQVTELAGRVEQLTTQAADLTAKVAELEAVLEAARKEAKEAKEQASKADSYLDVAQRTQADFVNYKRRAERERAEEAQSARADLLSQLLPALDDLERALGHVPDALRDNPWAEGLPLVARQLRLALARAGVERLGAEGDAFDPRLHEAVAYQPRPGYSEGQIAHVARPGYRIGERIIRPAQVVVAQGGEPAGDS